MNLIITPGEPTNFWGGSDVISEFSQHNNHDYGSERDHLEDPYWRK